jgi:hypothetical protein
MFLRHDFFLLLLLLLLLLLIAFPLQSDPARTHHESPDRGRYFDAARSSALEGAAGLDVRVATGQPTTDEGRDGEQEQEQGAFREAVCVRG